MSLGGNLIKVAEQLEAVADTILKTASASEQEQEKLKKQASATSEQLKKVEDDKANIGALAKAASARLLEAKLLSSPEQADVYAAQLLTHSGAIQKLAQLVSHIKPAPSLGQVVVDAAQTKIATANEVWDKHINAAQGMLRK